MGGGVGAVLLAAVAGAIWGGEGRAVSGAGAGGPAATGGGVSMPGWGAATGILGAALPGGGGPMSGWDGGGGVQDAAGAEAGGQVVGVVVSADAREPGAALVSMNYQLEMGPETDAVPFAILLFAPATVGEITARAGERALAVRLPDTGAPRLEGEIELPAELARPGRMSLELDYRVDGAVRAEGAGVRVVLPMLAVDWAPAEARPGMFRAEVTLPDGMEAREIFPVTPSGAGVPGVASASLQVLPAVVRVRALPEGSVGLSLPGVLELLVLVVVVACGMAGLRYVRRVR